MSSPRPTSTFVLSGQKVALLDATEGVHIVLTLWNDEDHVHVYDKLSAFEKNYTGSDLFYWAHTSAKGKANLSKKVMCWSCMYVLATKGSRVRK